MSEKYIENPKNGSVKLLFKKRQRRQDEEPRDIQPVDDPTAEPTTKGDVSAIK